jgi:hypothetical protein
VHGLSPDRRQREIGRALRFFSEATRLGGGGPINYGDDNIPVFLAIEIYKICHDLDISVQIAEEADRNFSYRRCFGTA